jgi:hypothetical protein
MTKTFEKWKIDELHQLFGLNRIFHDFEPLAHWLNTGPNTLTESDLQALEKIRIELSENAENWNEDELKFFFISHLISIADIKTNSVKIFTQRPLTAFINSIKLTGIVDFVMATGIAEPQEPYFFLHEYKQERKGSNDPLAQLLAEMLVAQHLNQEPRPIYGCYVMGRFWFFVVLLGTNYAVSDAFTATNTNLVQITLILRKIRQLIEGFTVS